ncbi:hypothetical protein CXG81DRAFT_15579 [Caulochytrium protostelioides]|uniref:Cdc23 domain-containing protein n=1 Tax=Caulochytrium protostelioides TaxID=1555241 RepID=A0A4P9X0X8_9FUNG|nr:hypothetical protein CXG81DRAFT_15579 [Caulochytrium protostelioides]|eukprot:RKO98692.1 hypothetical protein CXG81DRAFT_15579 [Caulochytrium protostelioides]
MGDDYLDELAAELRGLRASGRCDGFLLYLYGMVQARQLQREEAIATLLESIRYYPFNWSAWLELAECMRDRAHASAVYTTRLTPHLLTTHFLVQLSLDFNLDWETFEQALKRLLNVFPTSLQLKAQYALALYNGRAFEQAEATFEEITEQDPHSLEHMDTFSNVLYVLQKAERLALLAHHVMRIDPYQVQSCIVAGNYHSLKSDHDVAIRAFRRATQLDPQCFQAWTLMGHEFIELKQPHQAVLAYRRGLAINARDYRAWYGLGQTYEVLRLPFYALFYYQQAAALRPYDTRMWCALGECYLLVGKDSDAITCFKHALRGDDHQGHLALSALGRLYAKHGRRAQALDAFRTLLESCPPQHRVGEGYDFAAVYLARALAEQGHLRQAQELLEPVAGEEGRALKREIVRQLNQA